MTVVIGRTGGRVNSTQWRQPSATWWQGVQGQAHYFAQGRPVLDETLVVEAVRKAMEEASLDPQAYASHSFRIGAAMTEAQQGLQNSLIKTLRRWDSSA